MKLLDSFAKNNDCKNLAEQTFLVMENFKNIMTFGLFLFSQVLEANMTT